MNSRISLLAAILLTASMGVAAADVATPTLKPSLIDFAADVQPILRRHCDRCHGAKNQEASLQLNDRQSAWGVADSDEPIIVKHDPDDSLLIKRLVNEDYGDLMPSDGDPLSNGEVDLLRRWIAEGAVWPDEYAEAKHWAYQPIERPPVADAGRWAATPIDQFVLRRLNKRGLAPSKRADRARLIRRVSLALVGVPPTPEQVQDFVGDESEQAYERVVDRLLESQRYGERWAVPWLDLARYADSNGFQADQIRDNWAYRDWVIKAFNEDLPFDEFVIDQIAGDLRPNASIDQKIATGFHRMTTCNVEAGVDPEANRTNQIVDRVNTTATVFLGTTIECAQCHDHKYDPFSQQDYYQLFAFFNNTPLEVKNTGGVTWDFFGPTMDLSMDDSVRVRFETFQQQLSDLRRQRVDAVASSDQEFAGWLTLLGEHSKEPPQWQTVRPEKFETSGGEDFEILDDGSVLLTGTVPDVVEHAFTLAPSCERITAIKIDALTDDAIDGKGPGRGDAKRSNIILSELTVELIGDKETSAVALQNPAADFSQKGWPVANAIDGDRKTGWAISPQFGKPHWASFAFEQPLLIRPGIDRLRVTLGQFYGRGRVMGKPKVSFYTGPTEILGLDPDLLRLAGKEKRSKKDRNKLRQAFDKHNPALNSIDQKIARIERQESLVKPDTTLVMVEMNEPRETFILLRGDYENRGERVQAGLPQSLPQTESSGQRVDRLVLAKWLTSRQNPLLARVTVNRWWAELFGIGLVSTPEDFGTQAEAPSHPQLLDWLAAELFDSGWSMKHVLKQMVMSETFQQSARVTPTLLAADPNNRLLARGPRFRMPAELVRDNSLAISGILSTKMFGPPIMPHQPDNLWRSVGRNQPKWIVAQNEDRFRRGVYVVFKRAAPYPSFTNFDAPLRGVCTVSRSRSNTPIQALTLLNDPAYSEMAIAFADRVLTQSVDRSDEGRIQYAFKLAVARGANAYEINQLKDLLEAERVTLAEDTDLVLQRTRLRYAGLSLKSKDKAELAAWFAVTNVLLNLDETMTQ